MHMKLCFKNIYTKLKSIQISGMPRAFTNRAGTVINFDVIQYDITGVVEHFFLKRHKVLNLQTVQFVQATEHCYHT